MKCAVDIGFGFTKAISEQGREVVFPSAVAKTVLTDLGFGTFKDYYINYNNQTYAVGKAALDSIAPETNFTPERFTSNFARILVLTSFLATGVEGEVELGLGLPLMFYKTLKDKVKDYFEYSEDTVIDKENIAHSYHIVRCEVFPQGVGAFFTLDQQLSGRYCLVDVGFRTTDVITVEVEEENIEPILDLCFTIDKGMSLAIEKLSLLFERKFNVSYDSKFLMDIHERLSIPVRGRQVNIEEIKNDVYQTVANDIVQSVLKKLHNELDSLGCIFVAGGGAFYAASILQRTFENVQVLDNAQFANAKGFLKLLNVLDE